MTDTKLSFNDAVTEQKVAKHNSNMTNLAHAKIMVEEEINNLTKLLAEIEAAGNDPDVSDKTVRDLYRKAQDIR